MTRHVAWFALFILLGCAQIALASCPVCESYETAKVAEGIYAFIAAEPRTGLVSGNSVAIIGSEGVLVVDSGHIPSLTRKMIAEIRKLTSQPVRFVVNTHWHPDHLAGNQEYRTAFPGVVIVSTPVTLAQAAAQDPFYLDVDKSGLPAAVDSLKKTLQTGKRRNGSPLSDEDKQYIADEIGDLEAFLPEMRQIKLTLPDVTFEKALDISLGNRQVKVMFLGRGNTGGDAVIYVPDAKVLMTGDLVVNPTPYAFGSYFGEWIETLQKLKTFEADAIVPGHGPVEHNWDYVNLLIGLFESLRTQVQQAVDQGLSLDETRKKIDLSRFEKQFTGDNPLYVRGFHDGFLVPGVERAYDEAKFAKE